MDITLKNFSEKLEKAMSANGMGGLVTAEAADKLYRLTERMLAVNEHMNLTAITDIDGVILKHYADSLAVSRHIEDGATVIDVGCGAGFPSLPLAIVRPDLKLTALDSTAKRINYICETAEMLDIANITCIAARAEELAHDSAHREMYDISCARAVARLNVLAELCVPFVKPGGKFIAMKANFESELAEADTAIRTLGCEVTDIDSFTLISENGAATDPRGMITMSKISRTPKNYPRNNSQIKKKPL